MSTQYYIKNVVSYLCHLTMPVVPAYDVGNINRRGIGDVDLS